MSQHMCGAAECLTGRALFLLKLSHHLCLKKTVAGDFRPLTFSSTKLYLILIHGLKPFDYRFNS
jgi:hypothetical protein